MNCVRSIVCGVVNAFARVYAVKDVTAKLFFKLNSSARNTYRFTVWTRWSYTLNQRRQTRSFATISVSEDSACTPLGHRKPEIWSNQQTQCTRRKKFSRIPRGYGARIRIAFRYIYTMLSFTAALAVRLIVITVAVSEDNVLSKNTLFYSFCSDYSCDKMILCRLIAAHQLQWTSTKYEYVNFVIIF